VIAAFIGGAVSMLLLEGAAIAVVVLSSDSRDARRARRRRAELHRSILRRMS
jgi:hypothetical protein